MASVWRKRGQGRCGHGTGSNGGRARRKHGPASSLLGLIPAGLVLEPQLTPGDRVPERKPAQVQRRAPGHAAQEQQQLCCGRQCHPARFVTAGCRIVPCCASLSGFGWSSSYRGKTVKATGRKKKKKEGKKKKEEEDQPPSPPARRPPRPRSSRCPGFSAWCCQRPCPQPRSALPSPTTACTASPSEICGKTTTTERGPRARLHGEAVVACRPPSSIQPAKHVCMCVLCPARHPYAVPANVPTGTMASLPSTSPPATAV